MNYETFKKQTKGERRKPAHRESQIQQNCVLWFRLQYPAFRRMLFAVPNGGRRGKREAAIMKAEGVVPGVSDLILLVSRKGYNALCIECKTATGHQSDDQILWQAECDENGNKYVICRSIEGFICIINWYLK